MGDALLPNLFIPGAPKSGTTSLYEWLTPHPEVFMSPFKEPHYFCDDLTFRYNPFPDLATYLGLFGAAEDEPYRGEATTWYLYSKTAPARIAELCSTDVRILPMLRNPVEMLHSLHSQHVYQGVEPIRDFEAALAAEDDRKADPSRVEQPELLYYGEIVRYTDQLERYVDTFGRENVHVILFDDLVEDEAAVYRDVCRFLDIDPTVDPGFEKANPNTSVRSHWLRDVTENLPSPIQAVTEKLPMSVRLKLREIVNRANTKAEPRDPMDPETREHLKDRFRDEVQALGEMLDRDLSHWTAPEHEARS